jgi:signal transduction histidine kinase
MTTCPGLLCRVVGVPAAQQNELSPRPPLLHRVTPRQLQIVDFAVAAVLVFVAGAHSAGSGNNGFGGPPVFVLALFVGLSIAIRRTAPIAALFVATIAIAIAATVAPVNESWLGPFIALPMYQVAAAHDRRRSLPALVLVVVGLSVAAEIGFLTEHRGGVSVLGIVVAVAAWFVGDSVRVRRVYVAGLAEQAAQRQREVVERAQRSLAEQRLQIARELHDVVAHSLSVIAVQSGVGRHVIDEQPAEAKKALAAVEATSRAALGELRRLLGVLRRDDGAPAALAPAPGVAALGPLVEQVRAAGFAVSLDARSVAVRALSPSVELSIYRIVQEALTNVVKHAGPAAVRVEFRDETDALVLEINDDGRGITSLSTDPTDPASPETHHGIVGMRERVALFDGSLLAEPRPEGGFRVIARFPIDCLTSS